MNTKPHSSTARPKERPVCSASLPAAYGRIGREHQNALRERAARSVLGASVIRVFNKKTKSPVMRHLADKVDLGGLKVIKSQKAYRKWFKRELDRLALVIKKNNKRNPRILPGLKWGHASKVLCLYVRDVVLCSRYFTDADATRIEKWLYVPIDGIVMKELKSLGGRLRFGKIREIATARDFYLVQEEILGEAAREAGVPRVFFDDVWVSRPATGNER